MAQLRHLLMFPVILVSLHILGWQGCCSIFNYYSSTCGPLEDHIRRKSKVGTQDIHPERSEILTVDVSLLNIAHALYTQGVPFVIDVE